MKRIAAAFSALGLGALSIVAGSTPASAATSGSYCFVMKGPTLPYHPWDQLPTFVQLDPENTNSGWVTVAQTLTDNKGCAHFTLTAEESKYYVRATALHFDKGGDKIYTTWFGVSPNVGTPGNGDVHLGTGIVYCKPALEACLRGTT